MREKIEAIIQYELGSMTSGSVYPIVKVVNHFGEETICKAYGCTKCSDTIAKELVRIAFDEADK